MNSLKYLIREGFRSIWTNRLMTLASVGVLMSCLVIMGCSVLVSVNTNAMLDRIEEQNVVMAFIKDGAQKEQVQQVGQDLKNIKNISKVVFVSKEEAWEQQLAEMGDAQAAFFKSYDESNPLPDAYKVTLKDMGQFDQTVRQIKGVSHVETVRENRDLAAKLTNIRQALTVISAAIVLILFVVSIFIISNTIKLTMYSRRLEISIMKSVGATNAFVRLPFAVEGMVIGIISGVFSLLLVFGIYQFAVSRLHTMISMGRTVPFGSVAGWLLIGFILIGIVTGAGGSIVSMNKYLKHEGSELNEV